MNVVAIIPAKGFSSRLYEKNIYPLFNKPLICWTIDAALQSKFINEIFISTESNKVISVVNDHYLDDVRINIIKRPERLCENNVGKQQVIEHAVNEIEKNITVNTICILQANSPQIKTNKIDEAIEKVVNGKALQCCSINKDTLFTDGAIRVARRHCLNDKGLGMYLSIVLTDYIDIHDIEDIEQVKMILKSEIV